MARNIRVDRESEVVVDVKYAGLARLLQILSFLVVFVAGIILGLATTAHFNQHFNSQAHLYLSTNRASSSESPFHHHNHNNNNNYNCTTNDAYCVQQLQHEQQEEAVVDCLDMDTFLHPNNNNNNIAHKMSDEELIWRASMVPRKDTYPYNRFPKVAFMFLTRGPLPMLPLWEKFFHGQDRNLFSIYIHALPGYYINVSADSPFFNRQIPSQNVKWGTATLTDAERRLLANALLDFSNERFVLLSESCIPIYNFPTVYKYLTDSHYSYVESYDDPTRYGRGRYSRSMLPDITLRQWRKGSQWFELNRDLATYIISDSKYYTLFKKYCLPACYPDEHYLPTFLNMFHGSKNSNRSVTWVDWSLGGPHPAMYFEANITEDFVRSLRNNGTSCSYNSEPTSICYLFARKFDPSALGPLLNLSSTVMEF